MRIAFIVGQFPSLSQTFILDQVTGLLDMGHDVQVFSQQNPDRQCMHPDVTKYNLLSRTHYLQEFPEKKSKRIIVAAVLSSYAISQSPFKALRFLFAMLIHGEKSPLRKLCRMNAFKGLKFDVVHCHFGPNGLFALDLKDAGLIKTFVTTFHGYDINQYPKTAGKDVYKRLFEKGDLFTANTNFTKSQMVELGCTPEKVKILPVGLKMDIFQFKERKVAADEQVTILTVGRLVEKKGYEYAIKAFAKLAGKYDNIDYSIVGDGPLHEKFKSLVHDLGIENFVRFQGALNRTEVLQMYAKSDIFLLPSVTAATGDMEGQGLVLQEAQAVGLPVLSTLHNGIPDGVLDGKTGFLVPEKDVDALVERLEFLIHNPQERITMGASGRKFVEDRYDIEELNAELMEIYRELL